MKELLPGKEAGSLRSRVFATLEQAIINGEYQGGDTLNELKLSQQLGVSRTPIREALTQLELEGLVEINQNRGAVVLGVSAQDVEDIYLIRLHLEGYATALATERMTIEEITELRRIVELQEFYISKNDTEQLRKLDADFHNSIYRATGNRFLKNLLTSFHNQIQRGRALSLKVSGRSPKSVEEHRKILEAIIARDSELASQLMSEHLNNAFNNYRMQVETKMN